MHNECLDMTGYLVIIGCKLVVSECSVVVVELNAGHIPAVPHQRFVVSDQLHGVLQVPAVATEVLEARQVPGVVGLNYMYLQRYGNDYLQK